MDLPKAPHADQDVHEISTLIQGLDNKSNKTKKGFRAKKTSFKVHGSRDGIVVDSWRFQDYDYKRPDLPTYARGLFTTKNRRNQPEIAIRGYDKFFNTGEVSDTKWENIKKKTHGPYELTLKENGCIIFIGGLEDETLLVCSKHSTGPRSDVALSHSMAGEKWVDRQLHTIGKTRAELARELRKRNATAVAELCDDDFEEHVLAYTPDKAGLYLHGININIPRFMTYPSDQVQKFADEWGFRKVGLQSFDDIDTVKTFLDGVAESGAHEGRDVEGFVIRCKMSENPDGGLSYHDWFFKYKFEEPYLMYRQWRECTKALIAGKPQKFKKHVKITEEYLLYARKRLAQDPKLGNLYNQNHGIIALRDDFLKFKNLKGSEAANCEAEFGGDDDAALVDSGIVIVPIATIGCGKTTIGVALCHLFRWGHIQNDNIQGKGRPARMVQGVMQLLAQNPAVIADRNNSERREREQIIKDIKLQNTEARLVAMNFSHGDIEEVRRVTRERVLRRGDNHQTIQAASDESKVIAIMENFIHRFQPCDASQRPDDGFDLVIDLDPSKDSRTNLEIMINALHEKYPRLVPDIPSSEDMDEAIKAAIEEYTPDLRHTIPDRKDNKKDKQAHNQEQGKAQKKKPLEYMSISVPAKDVNGALEAAFKGVDPSTSRFYKQLQSTRRVQPMFHVTLMHRASSKDHPELWSQYVKMEAETASTDGKLGECEIELERVVFDNRIMAIVVRIVDPDGKWTCVNRISHITVGTRDDNVKPKESNDLLAKWLEFGTGGEIMERVFEPKLTLKGVVRGVLSR
ncbi:RNA ligase-domain-containing protein [Pseudomassariella vexata]|uniref:tRNA ligase n=1 Tax=Pseudomassariella vexata TaxID=1141098 RepID=A0A1Y2DTB2_9PEZI|nr:RNA ligase-domain-containing protein [Pseudomassariella vexata]ORY62376.1 RNA ligase-domain-containing protein [Pseudomassariella vexata]